MSILAFLLLLLLGTIILASTIRFDIIEDDTAVIYATLIFGIFFTWLSHQRDLLPHNPVNYFLYHNLFLNLGAEILVGYIVFALDIFSNLKPSLRALWRTITIVIILVVCTYLITHTGEITAKFGYFEIADSVQNFAMELLTVIVVIGAMILYDLYCMYRQEKSRKKYYRALLTSLCLSLTVVILFHFFMFSSEILLLKVAALGSIATAITASNYMKNDIGWLSMTILHLLVFWAIASMESMPMLLKASITAELAGAELMLVFLPPD